MKMETEQDFNKIHAFDTLFTNNHIQIYKVLLPYFEPGIQRQLAVYIKYMEFQYTLFYFKNHPYAYSPKEQIPDAEALCKEVLPFCSSSEKEQIKKMTELFSTMKNAREMMDTLAMMKDLFPEGFSFGKDEEGMPDIMQMFSMFGNQ